MLPLINMYLVTNKEQYQKLNLRIETGGAENDN